MPDFRHLYDEALEIVKCLSLRDVLDRTVNELIFKMGYLGSVVFLLKGDRLY